MAPTDLFLDTEWADWEGRELVSLALITADGGTTFYAERDPLPSDPTEFVRENVYPLLQRGAFAKQDLAFVRDLRAFLQHIPNPRIVYDYKNDADLLHAALGGLRMIPSELVDCPPPPRNLATILVKDQLTSSILEDWFDANPAEASRRHHALVDANALRVACLARSGEIDAHWSRSWQEASRAG